MVEATYHAEQVALLRGGIVTKAASFTVDAPAPGSTATVEWYYGGSYSGKALEYITASGTVG